MQSNGLRDNLGLRISVGAQTQSDSTYIQEALRSQGLISDENIERIQAAVTARDLAFSTAATRLGLVTEHDMAQAFSDLLDIPLIDRARYNRREPLPAQINIQFLKKHSVFPLDEQNGTVPLAMANPLDDVAIEGLVFALGKPIKRLAALESDIDDQIQRTIDMLDEEIGKPDSVSAADLHSVHGDDVDRLADHESDAPAIRLAHRFITQAADRGASDIHFEPSADALQVRYRIDGLLQPVETLSGRWVQPVCSRLKLMARLDIAEKRLPQDGRINFTSRGKQIDLRVATFPTLHGEAVVLRLLGQHTVSPKLSGLGLDAESLSALRDALKKPHGIALITGPTGSGKTTTLYAALNEILRPELKIVTVEDPIEYTLPGVAQLQVKTDIGLTYGAALRSVLRNDPDVIMIGEVRDRETADIAVRAALTGHLVLATLHTNTAAGALTRLADLGIERYLLASTLIFSAAQRLVRRLCPRCQTTRDIRASEVKLFTAANVPIPVNRQLPLAVGCDACQGRGFRGRIPLFEALPIDAPQREHIRDESPEEALVRSAAHTSGGSLWRHGLQRVLDGETTLDEVLGVVEERSA